MIVPMYHPAAALHNGSLKATIEEDFRKLPKFLAEVERLREEESPREEPPTTQMSLF